MGVYLNQLTTTSPSIVPTSRRPESPGEGSPVRSMMFGLFRLNQRHDRQGAFRSTLNPVSEERRSAPILRFAKLKRPVQTEVGDGERKQTRQRTLRHS